MVVETTNNEGDLTRTMIAVLRRPFSVAVSVGHSEVAFWPRCAGKGTPGAASDIQA
jgi:hypothetical protein